MSLVVRVAELLAWPRLMGSHSSCEISALGTNFATSSWWSSTSADQ